MVYLDMPESLHDEIARKFDGEQAKRELFRTWLAGHPCPTWDHVERLLRGLEREGRGREGAAEEVKETYLKSELLFILFCQVHVQYMYTHVCTCTHTYMYQSTLTASLCFALTHEYMYILYICCTCICDPLKETVFFAIG